MRFSTLLCSLSACAAQDLFLASSPAVDSTEIAADSAAPGIVSDVLAKKLGLDTAARGAAEEWLAAVSKQLNRPAMEEPNQSLHGSDEAPLERFEIPSGQGGARCMDGSPYSFYFRKAPSGSEHANNWVFFMRGGGLCISILDCRQRAKGHLGTSTVWEDTYTDPDGLLSANATFNPFHDFNHVFLPYCSGDTHTGAQAKRNAYGLYFAGALNLEETVTELLLNHGLGGAERVIVSGASAGGIGAHNNADWFQSRLPNTQVSGLMVAGQFFPDQIELSELWLLRQLHLFAPHISVNDLFSSVVTDVYSSRLPPVCANNTGPEYAYRCWDAAFNYDHIDVPMLVVQNQFDQNQIEGIMLCFGCEKWPLHAGKSYIAHFGDAMRKTLRAPPKFSSRRHSVYSPSCYKHTENLCFRYGTAIGHHQLADVARAWFFEGVDVNIIDSCSWSPLSMPCNSQCSDACHFEDEGWD